jgi:hypothetical protein
LIGRITPACQKLLNELHNPFSENLSLDDVNLQIPKNYNINISNIID